MFLVGYNNPLSGKGASRSQQVTHLHRSTMPFGLTESPQNLPVPGVSAKESALKLDLEAPAGKCHSVLSRMLLDWFQGQGGCFLILISQSTNNF